MRESLYETAKRLDRDGFKNIAKAVREVADRGTEGEATDLALYFRR